MYSSVKTTPTAHLYLKAADNKLPFHSCVTKESLWRNKTYHTDLPELSHLHLLIGVIDTVQPQKSSSQI